MCTELVRDNGFVLKTLRYVCNWRNPDAQGGGRMEMCTGKAEPCMLGHKISTNVGPYHKPGLVRRTEVPKTTRRRMAIVRIYEVRI